jgi:phosphoglycolate phosphatase
MAGSSCSATTRTYDLIVFDLDGVIIDSVGDIVAAVHHTLKLVGSQDRDFAFIRSCIPNTIRPFLLPCLDDHSKDRIDEAVEVYKTYYEQNCTRHTVLYPGVREALEYFAGKKKLAVATSNLSPATSKMLEGLNVFRYFDLIVTGDDVERSKPDPESVNYILETLGCSRDAAIMVGDTPTDIVTGKNAGIATCAVLYGIGTLAELNRCAPDFMVENLTELKQIVTV